MYIHRVNVSWRRRRTKETEVTGRENGDFNFLEESDWGKLRIEWDRVKPHGEVHLETPATRPYIPFMYDDNILAYVFFPFGIRILKLSPSCNAFQWQKSKVRYLPHIHYLIVHMNPIGGWWMTRICFKVFNITLEGNCSYAHMGRMRFSSITYSSTHTQRL